LGVFEIGNRGMMRNIVMEGGTQEEGQE